MMRTLIGRFARWLAVTSGVWPRASVFIYVDTTLDAASPAGRALSAREDALARRRHGPDAVIAVILRTRTAPTSAHQPPDWSALLSPPDLASTAEDPR